MPLDFGSKYVKVTMVHMERLSEPLVIEADTAEMKDHELVVKLGDTIVARFPERSVRSWWIADMHSH